MKTCSRCQRRLPQTEFWKRDASPDGLQKRCKECQRPGYADRWKEAERIRIADYGRAWRTVNADRVSEYRGRTRDQRLATERRARYRRRIARHLKETEEVYRLWHSLYGHGEPAAPIDPRALLTEWETHDIPNICGNGCGRGWRAIAHLTPLYEGGEHTTANLVPVCNKPTCSPAGPGSVATATDQPNT